MAGGKWLLPAIGLWFATFVGTAATPVEAQGAKRLKSAGHEVAMFSPSRECMACHNSLVAPSGEDVSIGIA